MSEVIEKLSLGIAIRKVEFVEYYMEGTLPSWYVMFVKRGGLLRWIATRIVKVYIIKQR